MPYSCCDLITAMDTSNKLLARTGHNTDAAGLAVDEVLLAQNMQDDCGYTTAIFG